MSDTKAIFGLLAFLLFVGVAFGAVGSLYVQMEMESGVSQCAAFDPNNTEQFAPPEPSGNWLVDIFVYLPSLASYMVGILFHPCVSSVTWFFIIILVPLITALIIKLVRG